MGDTQQQTHTNTRQRNWKKTEWNVLSPWFYLSIVVVHAYFLADLQNQPYFAVYPANILLMQTKHTSSKGGSLRSLKRYLPGPKISIAHAPSLLVQHACIRYWVIHVEVPQILQHGIVHTKHSDSMIPNVCYTNGCSETAAHQLSISFKLRCAFHFSGVIFVQYFTCSLWKNSAFSLSTENTMLMHLGSKWLTFLLPNVSHSLIDWLLHFYITSEHLLKRLRATKWKRQNEKENCIGALVLFSQELDCQPGNEFVF